MGSKVNMASLKQSINKYGSLEKAIMALDKEKDALEARIIDLKEQVTHIKEEYGQVWAEVQTIRGNIIKEEKELKEIADKVVKYGYQFKLFEGFLAMLLTSPSVSEPLENLTALFNKLVDSGWATSHDAEELRDYFVTEVIGNYIKCFKCDSCGAKFIVNKKPYYSSLHYLYQCPACHAHQNKVKADDSLITALVSNKQLDVIKSTVKLQEQLDGFTPFKSLFGVTCRMCKKPVDHWTDDNVAALVEGAGFGHDTCWNSNPGKVLLFSIYFNKNEISNQAGSGKG